jgi:hypothetical protein
MRTDLKSRGFTLTPALCAAVESGARGFASRFPALDVRLQVRLFDVNGRRGGIDKGCLVHARLGRHRTSVVASGLDSDLYGAIAAAFGKLERATQTTLGRNRPARHSQPERDLPAES